MPATYLLQIHCGIVCVYRLWGPSSRWRLLRPSLQTIAKNSARSCGVAQTPLKLRTCGMSRKIRGEEQGNWNHLGASRRSDAGPCWYVQANNGLEMRIWIRIWIYWPANPKIEAPYLFPPLKKKDLHSAWGGCSHFQRKNRTTFWIFSGFAKAH